MTTITPLPTPPSRQDPANFNDRADAFLSALPTFATQTNAVASETNTASTNAVNASNAVIAATNITKWVSGTTYANGAVVWSPINGLGYRRITASGSGTTDPSLDTTNYKQVNGTGDVSTSGNQTISGVKTFSSGITGAVSQSNSTFTQDSNYALISGTLGVVFASGYPTNTSRVVVDTTSIRPSVDNSTTCGTSAARWSVVYSASGVVTTSDGREKTEISELDEAEKRVAIKLKALVRKFKFNNGDNKKHVGIIAQELIQSFASEGLNAFDYAVIDYQEWDSSFDSEGNEVVKAGNRYGVNYNELFAFIIAV